MQVNPNIQLNTEKACDFCKSNDLEPIYKVPVSRRGVIVAVCNTCGLIQSLPTKERDRERIISTSSGPDWGNIRHGKGLRLNSVLPFLREAITWNSVKSILDVGSNRGDFVLWVREYNSDVYIVAVEPDGRLVDDYKDLNNLMLYINRIEQVELPQEQFDFIYCSHTLEHADSASRMLKQIYDATKTGGHLFLEVPNVEILYDKNNVEEFFMDKHSYHFNKSILCAYLRHIGFEIVHDRSDIYNISLLLKKLSSVDTNLPFQTNNEKLSIDNKEMIKKYVQVLQDNRNKLKNVANRLHQFFDRQKVVIWGAGRIFDALIKYGGLRTDKIVALVDEYLWRVHPKVHNMAVKKPDFIRLATPDVVIILARSSADEIESKVRKFGVRHVIKFSNLLLAE